MSSVRIGEPAPDFALASVSTLDATPRLVQRSDYLGRWLALIFYPRDFSFVCPTELTAFSARLADFGKRDCELLGISVDSIQLHQEWLTTPITEGGLGPLQFPLASDPDGIAARAFGVWVDEKEVSTRGLFIIDPDGNLQYSVVHSLSVGRSPDEVLRVLDALRTGGLCPVSWTSADGTIDVEQALKPGRILGHYRIHAQLGGGTFGTVFAAWDLRLERMVALKVLKRKVFESREAILAEARAAAKLTHPNVCTVYAVEEEDGLPVIAMEYLDGDPLSQVIAEGLERHAVLKLAAQIASGLAAAHGENVVHGDLKPANIIVTKDGTAKILDFGLASSQPDTSSPDADSRPKRPQGAMPDVAESIGDVEATLDLSDPTLILAKDSSDQASVIQGTPAYMSPEQADGFLATPASDVFSFGLVLFEMLTGHRALAEPAPIKLLLRLQTEDLRRDLVPQVDEAYRELLTAMLARDQEQRPAMTEVVQKLSGLQGTKR
ncbi:MAG: protein kinase [Planctomycetes bacterium]|nr:protein kinase [Planctomycetota bacterium]MBL7043444.1 protein kinase [Pirellulaceae bacterium]